MHNQGRRATSKQRTRDAIEAAAWRLFARDGFDDVTVDDIAAAVDIAPRTFFRYFDTKEAVLYGDWRAELQQFCECLRQRPADEAPFAAVVATVAEFVDTLEQDTTELLQRARIVARPHHSGRYGVGVVYPETVAAIAAVLAERLGVDVDTDLRPKLYARLVSVALDTARDVWIATGGRRPLTRVVEEVFAELGASIVVPS